MTTQDVAETSLWVVVTQDDYDVDWPRLHLQGALVAQTPSATGER
jgi:hypothetical protein